MPWRLTITVTPFHPFSLFLLLPLLILLFLPFPRLSGLTILLTDYLATHSSFKCLLMLCDNFTPLSPSFPFYLLYISFCFIPLIIVLISPQVFLHLSLSAFSLNSQWGTFVLTTWQPVHHPRWSIALPLTPCLSFLLNPPVSLYPSLTSFSLSPYLFGIQS